MAETKQVIVKVKRQAGPKEKARWEEFALKWRPSMNVIICLRDIAENPVTRDGKKPLRSPTIRIAWRRFADRARC